jgi:hypothetical protein
MADMAHISGTQFTCFTGTKAQILTLLLMLRTAGVWCGAAGEEGHKKTQKT